MEYGSAVTMDRQDDRLVAWRERTRERIETCKLAGQDTRHNRVANLQAVSSVVEGDSHYTWDIAGVERFSFDETLEAIASITGCSRDPQVTSGGGYISPRATLAALEEAAERITSTARRGGRFLLGTGHPGSLLEFYIDLGGMIRSLGGVIEQPAAGTAVPPNLEIGYVEGVAVTTDRASLMHSHGHRAMDTMIEQVSRVDLVVADHGYAGAAVNAGVPAVAIMDTNDPALALARRLGADLTIIPMDDNRPLGAYYPIVEAIRDYADISGPTAETSRPEHGAEGGRNGLWSRIADAERFVAERFPAQEGLDELVKGFLQSYRDQVVQSMHEDGTGERHEIDVVCDIVLFTRVHDALHRMIERSAERSLGEEGREIVHAYLDAAEQRMHSRAK
jgi:hypothetical protein